jgi:hypothetical protein
MAIKTAEELKAYFETGDIPTEQQFVDLIDSTYRGYKVYTALLTQSGTDAPVATVLENTLGYEPVFYRINTGSYRVDPTAPLIAPTFNPSKVVMFIGHNTTSNAGNYNSLEYLGLDNGDGTVNIVTYNTDGDTFVTADGVLNYTPIEIRVYN